MRPLRRGEIVWNRIPKSFNGTHWTYELNGPFVVMVQDSGYIMARRKGCVPFVLGRKEALDERGEIIL